MEGHVIGLGTVPPSHCKLLQHIASSSLKEENVVIRNGSTTEEREKSIEIYMYVYYAHTLTHIYIYIFL